MKILDWIHRKLRPATKYSRVSHTKATAFELDVVDLVEPVDRSPSPAGAEPDSEAPLLLHVSLAGILTIGTLGHSHLLFLHHFSEEPNLELPEKEVQLTAKPPAQITPLQPAAEPFLIKTEQSSVEFHALDEKIMAEPLLKEEKGRKERTTLADLLTAEKATNGQDQPPVTAGQVKSAPTLEFESGGKEKKKKKVKRKKKGNDLESSQAERPAAAERIHRMMTRMVKKKIHPEAAATEGKTGGGGGGGGGDAA